MLFVVATAACAALIAVGLIARSASSRHDDSLLSYERALTSLRKIAEHPTLIEAHTASPVSNVEEYVHVLDTANVPTNVRRLHAGRTTPRRSAAQFRPDVNVVDRRPTVAHLPTRAVSAPSEPQ